MNRPGQIAGACVATATGGGPPMWVDTRAVSEPRRLDLTSSSAVPLADGACVALSDGGGRLSAGSRPARSDGEKYSVATVVVESLTTAAGVPVGSPSSHARTRAAARRCPVRRDQARISPPASVRSRTRRDWRAGCRAKPGTHPGGRAEYAPRPASVTVGSGDPAVVGNGAAVAVPGGAVDNAVVAGRWSKPWQLRTVT